MAVSLTLEAKRAHERVFMSQLSPGMLFVTGEKYYDDPKEHFIVVKTSPGMVASGYVAALKLGTQEVRLFSETASVIPGGDLEVKVLKV